MLRTSKYIELVDLNENESLIFSTRTGQLQHLKKNIYNQILESNFSKLSQIVIEKLSQAKILVPYDEDEYNAVIGDLKPEDSDVLSFTLLPTADCQLGCLYCGQVHEKIRMDNKMCTDVIDYILNRLEGNRYENLEITWYGAEPLLNIEAIELISSALINFCQMNNIKYSSSMVSNGLALTESVFIKMVNSMITSFQITLDGTQIYHDSSRPTKNQGKTFETIIKNIIAASKNPIYDKNECEITIRCNIHKNNHTSINAFIEHLHKQGIANKIAVYFHPVLDWGGNNAHKEIGLSGQEYGLLEIEWMIKLKELGFRLSKKDVLPSVINSINCMVFSRHSEMIDSKGRLSLCWKVPHTPMFDYPDSDLINGNITSLSINKNRDSSPFSNWIRDIDEEKYGMKCKQCKYLPVCLGSCPINWYSGITDCPQFIYNIKDRMVFNYILTLEEKQKEEEMASA